MQIPNAPLVIASTARVEIEAAILEIYVLLLLVIKIQTVLMGIVQIAIVLLAIMRLLQAAVVMDYIAPMTLRVPLNLAISLLKHAWDFRWYQ